ncbi:MAG TPA: heparan-alpha-glucosaminide N-acetyltransferase domain-containing protein [Alphaproteobacteria bacterium]|nr:heparan-alpha-glucosaminide N-acetyltransferase domain-containing protein [Alphaproteobacteria bacterium]
MAEKTASQSSTRIASIDIIRGIVMVLMAIDHVRVFAGVPAGGPTPSLFFTRWVTHFCAPIFVFLAGTGAYLYGKKHGSTGALARYLAVRGAWLVLLELTLLRFAWTFNFDYSHYMLAGVIWVIGWCMILMAALVRFPTAVIAGIGVTIIAGHNIIDRFLSQLPPLEGGLSWLWKILYFGWTVNLGPKGPVLYVLYVIVPWIGVMAAGFAFGAILRMDAARRNRICYQLGLASIVLFLVLRGFNLYGDPRPWSAPPRVTAGATGTPSAPTAQPSQPQRPRMPGYLSFLNTTKYPASLLFLLMTLGPMFLAVPLLENARGPVAGVFTTFGRVPLFYYLLHIPLIHVAAIVVSLIRLGTVSPWLFTNHPMAPPRPPEGYVWSLGLLYLVWLVVVILLYFPCRWFEGLKKRNPATWLSFL